MLRQTKDLDWDHSLVHVNVERVKIREAPQYDRSVQINREFETRLFEHYNRAPYWDQRLAA